MPSPFPGMDPYLEAPGVWPGVHANLIVAFQELLNQKIRPRYVARIEERVYMEADDDAARQFSRVPDVVVEAAPVRPRGGMKPAAGVLAIADPVIIPAGDPVRQRRVEIQELPSRTVVTVIELLGPSNKTKRTAGRASFLKKRSEVLSSPASWVEIDLLRTGVSHRSKGRFRGRQYLVYSSPAALRPTAKAWPIRLADPLPVVGIPLRSPDPDAPLDLQAALTLAYDRAALDATTDYAVPPVPPLDPESAQWAEGVLRREKAR